MDSFSAVIAVVFSQLAAATFVDGGGTAAATARCSAATSVRTASPFATWRFRGLSALAIVGSSGTSIDTAHTEIVSVAVVVVTVAVAVSASADDAAIDIFVFASVAESTATAVTHSLNGIVACGRFAIR